MNALLLTVFTPAVGAVLLALIPSLPLAGWLNLLFSIVSLGGAAALALDVLATGSLTVTGFHIDAFNVYLVVLTTFVGLTTAIFSRPYMRHVCETGQVTRRCGSTTPCSRASCSPCYWH